MLVPITSRMYVYETVQESSIFNNFGSPIVLTASEGLTFCQSLITSLTISLSPTYW